MKVDIGITETNSDAVIEILNRLLSDENMLYVRTKNYHWNVTGPQFNDLHRFFEVQCNDLNRIIDYVAERVRSLGGMSLGTLAEFLRHTRLDEKPGEYSHAREMVSSLLSAHETIIRFLRADLEACADKHGTVGTGVFLTGLMEKHEMMAWMLRAYLDGISV